MGFFVQIVLCANIVQIVLHFEPSVLNLAAFMPAHDEKCSLSLYIDAAFQHRLAGAGSLHSQRKAAACIHLTCGNAVRQLRA